MVYILTQSSVKHPCSIGDLGPRVLLSLSLSLSLSLWLIPWSEEACRAHFPAQAFKTSLDFLRGSPVPTWEVKLCPRALLVFCVTHGILASFLLSLSYRRLRTTRFQSIKGLQHHMTQSLGVYWKTHLLSSIHHGECLEPRPRYLRWW